MSRENNDTCAICKESGANKTLNTIDQIALGFRKVINGVKIKVHETCFSDAIQIQNSVCDN